MSRTCPSPGPSPRQDPSCDSLDAPLKEAPRDDGKVRVEEPTSFQHTWRLWCIFLVLCLLSFISAVDATIVTTSLPTITREVGGAEQYVWIANAFVFASTAPQPLYGQIANVFGRRNPMLLAIALFALGSGVAGGARDVGMLIAGRTVQGLGSAGLYVLSDIIICDVVPPRHRAPYLSAVISTAALGTTVGPIIGGALAQVQWRWVFWLNLPISGVGFLAIFALLSVKYVRSPTWLQALARVDFLGNAIFIPSIISLFLGLIMGGVQYPWGSWRVIVPLVLGVLGWAAFHIHQASPICKEPSMPPRLFKHRTSAGGFLIIFLGAIIIQAISYFLPIYFQAVLGATPLMSGIDFLPFALAIIPFGGLSGLLMSKTGRYIPLHWLGFAMSAIGAGLLSTLSDTSSIAAWVCFQIVAAAGTAVVFTVTLPSTLAALPEPDVAVATGTYSFIRSFGLVWGVTLASIIFNGRVKDNLGKIADPAIRTVLSDGAAYAFASGDFVPELPSATTSEVIGVYVEALRTVWLAVVAVSGIGFLCVFVEKHVELRKDHKSEFGLVEKERDDSESTAEEGKGSISS